MHTRLLFMLLALFVQTTAIFADDETPTANLTFVVDNADRVEISVAGDALANIHTGTNTVEVTQWSNITIAPKEGCTIKSVVNSQNVELELTNGSVTFMVYEAAPETYTITSEKSSEVNFVIDVDDPAKVSVMNKDYSPIELQTGVNNLTMSTLKFPLMIGSTTYGQELYQVLLDGVEVDSYYGSYAVTPEENSIIKIQAAFPDKDCSVTFSYPEGIDSFFTAVCVNGEEKSLTDNSLDAKCGDIVALYFNASCWDSEESPIAVKINGKEENSFWSGYSFVLRDNSTVEVVQATAVEMITVSLEVDKPGNVIVYRVDKDYKDVVSLSKGANTVELPLDNSKLVITNVEEDGDESKITGITINGTPKTVAYYNEVELNNLDANDVIKVFTEGDFGTPEPSEPAITVDPAPDSTVECLTSVMFYLEAEFDYDDETDLFEVKNEEGIYFSLDGQKFCGAYANIDVETIQFVPSELIYRAGQYQLVIEKNALAWVREQDGEFVANEEAMVYTYTVEGVATDIAELPFTLNPAPGSTVESFEVTMTIKEGYDELDVAETMAYIYKDGKMLCGIYAEASDDYTSVTITPEEELTEACEYEIVFMPGAVYCDGDDYYYNADPLVFAYTLKEPDSMKAIEVPATREQGVYNLLGIRVADTTDNLPAGIYVVNGKKVKVK